MSALRPGGRARLVKIFNQDGRIEETILIIRFYKSFQYGQIKLGFIDK